MNPITNIRNLNKMNEREMALGINTKSSWHQKYCDSAWIYIGGLDYGLNEGDIISVFSQYGEVVNINLIRDKKTGKSRGFAFLCYEDQSSTVLAVVNLNGISLVRRLLRVDHVEEYKVPKYREDVNEETLKLSTEGCAPKPIDVKPTRQKSEKKESTSQKAKKDRKKEKKLAKQMKKEKKKRMIRGEEMEDRSGMEKDTWKEQKGMFINRRYEGEEFDYSEKFGKRKTPEPQEQKFNVRPDFDKADWRDIELFKIVREHSQKKNVEWKEEEHYVPKRFG
ncbi:hypothetical protein QR680_012190 [Steinernema hermaphroditum]|uniref:RRM domain-containing protein n=1 Tax=Steinernema hermaphroditum TaxID=289476 RepID=A0AA39I182_9BILA|nr:hypothetical protein QR680_012190 [Steinernema hermaphroditum]